MMGLARLLSPSCGRLATGGIFQFARLGLGAPAPDALRLAQRPARVARLLIRSYGRLATGGGPPPPGAPPPPPPGRGRAAAPPGRDPSAGGAPAARPRGRL